MSRLQVKKDDVAKILRSIADLTAKTVLVGIPESEAPRDDTEPVNNAALGYIHEHGSPANNIPARPFLIPGVTSAQERVTGKLKGAAKAALEGKADGVGKGLHAAGLVAQAAVRDKLNSGDFEPLSDATLRARARRGRQGAIDELASRAAGNAPSTETAKPLVDTGQLRNSINYVIRNK